MRNGRTSRKRRATIVSSVMPSPPRICMLRSTTRQIASEQMTLAMLDSCVPRSPRSSSQAVCQITRIVDQHIDLVETKIPSARRAVGRLGSAGQPMRIQHLLYPEGAVLREVTLG